MSDALLLGVQINAHPSGEVLDRRREGQESLPDLHRHPVDGLLPDARDVVSRHPELCADDGVVALLVTVGHPASVEAVRP